MLGFRIAALRREAGMSQSDLAKQLQVSPSTVGMYEQGRREPSAEMLVNLSRVLGVSVDYLLTGSASEQETQQLNRLLLGRITSADRHLQDRKDRPFSREELAVLLAAMLMEA